MLHQAAQKVMAEHHGTLPRSSAALRGLPGIGRYTASAIASISFGEVTAVVDGNVERVVQRLAGSSLPANEQWQIANHLISPRRPGDFNQAVMELGATVCTPLDPKCLDCPIREFCKQQGRHATGPKQVRLKKIADYALDLHRNRVRLTRRDASLKLMSGMWELPHATRPSAAADIAFTLKHSITNTDYTVRIVRQRSSEGKYVPFARLENLPLTGLTRKVLRKAGIII
jgi:A/G-specific adenine glycosylase